MSNFYNELENEKVVLRFESSDNDDIIQAEPFNVWNTVELVENLRSEGMRTKLNEIPEEERDGLIVFVRNALQLDDSTETGYEGSAVPPDVSSDGLPFVGAYYRYYLETDGWEQILIGTHSHENKSILDQIGGNISKIAIEESSNGLLFMGFKLDDNNDYQVVYKDINEFINENQTNPETKQELPELPADYNSEFPLYLVTNPDTGKIEWAQTNFALPKNNFNIITKTVDTDTNEIIFDRSIDLSTQSILVMVNGFFIQEPSIIMNSDSFVLSDNDGFSSGDKVTILILSNAADYVFDILKTKYITREAAEQLLIDGKVNLDGYVQKEDLKRFANEDLLNILREKYAPMHHSHDTRYAQWNHTHREFLTIEKARQIVSLEVSNLINENHLKSLLETLQKFNDQIKANPDLQTLITSKLSKADLQREGLKFFPSKNEFDTLKTDFETFLRKEFVDSVNGKTGKIILYGTDISLTEEDSTTIKEKFDSLDSEFTNISDKFTKLESAEEEQNNRISNINEYLDKIKRSVINETQDGEFLLKADTLDGSIRNELIKNDLVKVVDGSLLEISRDEYDSFLISTNKLSEILKGKADADNLFTESVINQLKSKFDDLGLIDRNTFYNSVYTRGQTEQLIEEKLAGFSGSTGEGGTIVLEGGFNYKGSVSTFNDLPTENKFNDVWNVIDTGVNYIWVDNLNNTGIPGWDNFSFDIESLKQNILNEVSGAQYNFEILITGNLLQYNEATDTFYYEKTLEELYDHNTLWVESTTPGLRMKNKAKINPVAKKITFYFESDSKPVSNYQMTVFGLSTGLSKISKDMYIPISGLEQYFSRNIIINCGSSSEVV